MFGDGDAANDVQNQALPRLFVHRRWTPTGHALRSKL